MTMKFRYKRRTSNKPVEEVSSALQPSRHRQVLHLSIQLIQGQTYRLGGIGQNRPIFEANLLVTIVFVTLGNKVFACMLYTYVVFEMRCVFQVDHINECHTYIKLIGRIGQTKIFNISFFV